jgi:hypothetical protein
MWYWWLIFPIMWFLIHLVRIFLHHRRFSDAMAVARAYAANGKEPPAEISRILGDRPC